MSWPLYVRCRPLPLFWTTRGSLTLSRRLPLGGRRGSATATGRATARAQSSRRAVTTASGVQQQRLAGSRGCIRRTVVVLADDRFDRGGGPEPACA